MLIDFQTHREELFNPLYFRIAKAKTRFVMNYGGSGSGKSHAQHQYDLINILDATHDTLIIRKYAADIYDSSYKLLEGLAKEYGIHHLFKWTYGNSKREILNVATGRRIFFRGLDDPEKIKSIVGVKRIVVEEGSQLTKEDFLELNRRARGIDGIQITFLFNPINETHWIKEHFFDNDVVREETTILHTTYKDNNFLTDADRKQIEDLSVISPNDYRIYALGQWGKADVQNAFAYNFEYDKHVKECKFLPNEQVRLIWDFNLNPFVVLAAHIFRDAQGHHIHFFKELVLEPGNVYQMCELVKETFPPQAIDRMLLAGDHTSNKREITHRENLSAWKIIIKELNISPKRVQVRANPRQAQIKDNRMVVNAALARHPDLRFDPSMSITINEMMYTEADEDGKLLKKNRDKEEQRADGLDCVRYTFWTWLYDYLDKPNKYS